MTERPYSECLSLALALAGIPDSNADEVSRMKAFLNKRARRAYDESPFWPRFYVAGEERIVSEEGLLPYEQEGKRTIKNCLRIHRSDPYKTEHAPEYTSFIAESDGVQIANYEPQELTSGAAIRVRAGESVIILPDAEGIYPESGTVRTGPISGRTAPIYQNEDNTNYTIEPSIIELVNGASSIYWSIIVGSSESWRSDTGDDYDTPDLAQTWTAQNGAFGDVIVEKVDTYAAHVTYTAAFEETYGEGEGENDEVPAEWCDYMAHGACADFLRAEKEYEAAALMESDAWNYLLPQLEAVSRMGGSHAKTRVLTHANMQAR